MLNIASTFERGLAYAAFLDRYASSEQRRRWDDFYATVKLTGDQLALLQSWTRTMKVLVVAGTWCGDCVNQCPIFEHFATACPRLDIRYFDRDDNPDLTAELQTCGGARVPTVVFLSEDGHVCGRYGDRTLSRYRSVVANLTGAACPTGLFQELSLTELVVQDWLNEFERIQWMLRTSSRLRQLHGD
jgi:hypothetical protein